MKTFSVIPLLALASLVAAGLEDAKYSVPVGASNFDSVIASQSVGTLTAFFAPWCGHCKSLEPVWTKVAQAFDGDGRVREPFHSFVREVNLTNLLHAPSPNPQCKLAHFDADNAENRDISSKYGVTGFPTLKFIPSGGKPAIDYNGARSEEAFLSFLNEHCGSHKIPGGGISSLAGRIPSLDKIANKFFGPKAARVELLASATALVENLKDETNTLITDYYLKIMQKWAEDSKGAKDWIDNEYGRLGKMVISRRSSFSGKKLEELQMRQNVLAAFTYVKEEAEKVVEKVEKVAEKVVERVKEEL